MKFDREIKQKITISAAQNAVGGYVNRWEDNLLPGLDIKAIESDLAQGSGNELDGKFRAVYSSSALCVNNFGILKDPNLSHKFTLLGESNLRPVEFEKKMPTGLHGTPPNLDAYFENDQYIIGIESKYIEHFSRKEAKFTDSYSIKNLHSLPNVFWTLKSKYENTKGYLDTAQLLKHSIGLLTNKASKKVKLLYLYWLPEDHINQNECIEHKKELTAFETDMKKLPGIEFYAMSYLDFWNKYKNDAVIGKHIKKVVKRYKI